jgi:arabinose-5-phosphate isomerase
MADFANECLRTGRQVLQDEANALLTLHDQLGDSFVEACNLVQACSGRVVVCGVGKSGHIGRKIAASLASLGKPSFFLHAAEAVHGDLGMITADDVVMLLSDSGETRETLNVLPAVRDIGARTIAITRNLDSTLARNVDVALCTCVEREADHLNLAPTTSALATLALGDALAIVTCLKAGFTEDDFARNHPGGALGQQLLGDDAV